MVLYEYNEKTPTFKFQVIGKKAWRNLLMFHLQQTNVFWCLATFQTFLLYSVFLCYVQKCDL